MNSPKAQRFLGVDYGEKRVGLAFGDDLGLASPLPAAVERTKEARLVRIQKIITERRVTAIVIGYPYNMDGTVGFKAREVDQFVKLLEKRFGLPVHRIDERLTSHEAESRLKTKKKPPSRRSGEVDSLAAAIILQDYLDHHFPAP